MRSLLVIVAPLAMILASATAGLGAEMVDNPVYQSWSKFKPGTSLTVLTVSDANGQKIQIEKTSTLISVTADKVVLEERTSFVVDGQKNAINPSKIEYPAKMEKPAEGTWIGGNIKPVVKESEVDMEVAGTKVKCKLVESTTETPGNKLVTKTWTSDQVPGQTAKSEARISGDMETTTTISVTAMTIK